MTAKTEYDVSDPLDIERYAQGLVDKTFRQIWELDLERLSLLIEEQKARYVVVDNKRKKGNLGQLVEERFFHYKPNNESRPDFEEAGVELKVSPYKINKDGTKSAKERLVLTMIDYYKVVEEDFDTGHFWNKCRHLLLVYYLWKQEIQENLDYQIKFARLFEPKGQDLQIIREDYEKIVSAIRQGKAHELSEGATTYLGAATKGANSSIRRGQPFSDIDAKPRAFAYKQSYMTVVLNEKILGKQPYESIVNQRVIEKFEEHITQKINRYRGYSVDELCDELKVSSKPKNIASLLGFRILGITKNQSEEFAKGNIIVKAIRISKNNTIKESMSFPTFKFKELVNEEWEDSTFGNYLYETRFFFVIYKEDSNGVLRLRGCQFWNAPVSDIENEVREMWERTVGLLKDGIQIWKDDKGRNHSNLPQKKENRISHVRPHGRDSNDTDELPDGRKYPKQCFWLNNTYILSQLNEEFKK